MVKTGIWYPDTGVNYTVTVEEQDEMVQLALQNMTLRVVTVVVGKNDTCILQGWVGSKHDPKFDLRFSCF